jgi:hypothetical protein
MTKRKKPEDKLPTGRPTTYSEQIAKDICRAVAVSSKGLRSVCNSNESWPCEDTIYAWMFDYPEFSERYYEAKQLQAARLADEIIQISDSSEDDLIMGERGPIINSAKVNRDKLRVNARQWTIARLAPKRWGDRNMVESTVTMKHEDMLKELE